MKTGMKNYLKCELAGLSVQEKFIKTFSNHPNVKYIRKAESNEDKRLHVDELFSINDKKYWFEIKAAKKFKRSDSNVVYDSILLELHGVIMPQNRGWIYGSVANGIAFEQHETFILFRREQLIKFIKDKTGINNSFDPIINNTKILSEYNSKYYQVYHRGGLDSWIWCPLENLKQNCEFKIIKEQN